jgi:hypothetical protein
MNPTCMSESEVKDIQEDYIYAADRGSTAYTEYQTMTRNFLCTMANLACFGEIVIVAVS